MNLCKTVLAVGLLVCAGSAQALVISDSWFYSADATFGGNANSSPAELRRFDPALGTLTSATLTLSALLTGIVGVENRSNIAVTVGGNIRASAAVDFQPLPLFGPTLSIPVDSDLNLSGTLTVDYNYEPFTTQIPEPGTMALLCVGLAAVELARRRRDWFRWHR